MVKRLLDSTAQELASYGRDEVLASIRGSEGRIIAAEMIAPAMAAVYDVSNPELAASMGADIVILNMLDVRQPTEYAVDLPDRADVLREVRRLTGRLIAVNLEPVDPQAVRITDDDFGPGAKSGRLATPENVAAAALMAKMTGTDIHHLRDCGYFGIALPENLLAYSIAIRGRRHTYRRMAMSLLR